MLQLITNSKLDINNFKKTFKDLVWTKLPRKLGKDHQDFFYIAEYSDEEKYVKIVVKPHLEMCITESYKNYTIDGKPAPENYKGARCDWGHYTEVRIDNKLLDKIKKIAKNKKDKETQTITWE
jgi:hypothetical protein